MRTANARIPGEMLRMLLVLVLLTALTAASVMRNAHWRSLLSMWQDCAAKSPNKSRTHNNLGNCYLLLGQHFSALAEYQKAVARDPGNLEAQYNLATTADTLGMYNLALPHYEMFCRFASQHYEKQRVRACSRLDELLASARNEKGALQ